MGAEPAKTLERVQFAEDYELDLRAGELRRSGRLLKLERIPTDLLSLLVEQQGRLVTREQIIERVWGKDVFLDTDNSINAAIRKIRQVLKDDPAQPRFIQTITGRGYRFIAPVTANGAATVTAEPVSLQPESPEDVAVEKPVARPPVGRLWMLVIGIAVVVVAALGAYFQWFLPRNRQQSATERVVLAVLPFQNLTGDAAQDYFSDGMTEEMIAQLGRLDPEHLGVIARTSVMVYKQSPKPLDQIGRELGSQYVLEGSVRRDSDKVRITAQLIQMKDQTHVWSRQYDRELSNLLALEGEIAEEIATEIQLTLGDKRKRTEVARKPALSPEQYGAYDLYLKGLYFWNKRTMADFKQASEYFQQALDKDPNYARAYAGLADCYSLMGGYSLDLHPDLMPKARAAALKGLELDDSLAEAHTALALVVQNYDHDWQTADKEFRRAIELNPNYATGHQWYAEHLSFLGRFDEALRESEQARQLDPLSLIIAADDGAILYFARQYDRAIAQFRVVLDMAPDFPRGGLIVHAYVEKGLFADALAQVERRRRLDGDNPWIRAENVYVYSRAGKPEEARPALERLEEYYRRHSLSGEPMIWALAGMGDKEKTLAWLEKAFAQHSNAMTTLKVDPAYDFLRGDPRFQDLIRRVGLAQ